MLYFVERKRFYMKNILLSENNIFSASEFEKPSVIYSPTYNWIWNGEVSREETDRQLSEMQRLGIRSFCIVPEPKDFRPNSMPTFLAPDYLTKPYFDEYAYTVKRARELGMTVIFYDEGGWPSGGACGKVMLKHPEYARRILSKREIPLPKGEAYKKQNDTIGAYVDKKEINDGFSTSEECTVTEYYEEALCFSAPGVPDIPDITRKEAAECFIELTHEKYKPYLNEYFGDTVLCVFTDEPQGPSPVPFREELEKAFLKENGYSIRKYLPSLLSCEEMPEAAAQAKIAWLDLCTRFLCDNFLKIEKEWSNRHGLLFTGHMDGDHNALCGCVKYGHYHIMRTLRCFDIPGIDVIWRQIYPTYINNGRDAIDFNNGFFPRYASSAAAQVCSRRVLTESMGVYGAGTTFNDMRYVLGYQAVRGINVFNIFGMSYHREGFGMTGEMPHFSEQQACYKHLSHFNSYAERLSYLASLGERAANVGYYLPVNDFWVEGERYKIAKIYENIGQSLEDENILFDIIDDDVIKASAESCKKGIISMGNGSYDTVVVPMCEYMPQQSKKILGDFAKNGGKLIVISKEEILGLVGAVYTDTVKNILPKALEITGDTEKIRLGVRDAENGRLYILFNENAEKKTFRVKCGKRLVRLYAENGKIIKPETNEITLESGEAAFLFDGDLPYEKETTYSSQTEICGDWYVKRVDRLIIGNMNFETEHFDEPYTKTELGAFTELYGKDYSGSVMYKTSFKAPKKDGTVLIDLGDVRYTCEVFVNGKSKGVSAMSPYRLELFANELLEENILEICVTNTPANEHEGTKSFDKWQKWQLSTYYPTQKLYHADSLSGGLIGPVVLKF